MRVNTFNFFNRCKRFINATMITLLCMVFFNCIMAQSDWDNVEIKTTKITDNFFMLEGRGGNIGIQIGEEGVLLIDSQFAPLSDKIHNAIRSLSDGPIKYLLNTHWHGDHTGGNEGMARHGAVIVAHDNVLARMSTTQLMKAFSTEIPPSPEAARPRITFSTDMTIQFNGEKALLLHFDNAHTDGDAVIYFPVSNVIHMGDIYFNGRYPFIDAGSGGTIDGIINAVNQVLFIANNDTKIIPGHGLLSNRDELLTYRDVLLTVRNNIHDALAAGKSEEEIKAMNMGGKYEETWGGQWTKASDLAEYVLRGLDN